CQAAARSAGGASASLVAAGTPSGAAALIEGTARMCSGDYAAGLEAINRIKGEGTFPAEGQVNEADALLETGDLLGARAAADRILADRGVEDLPRSGAYLVRARARYQQGDLTGAVADFTESTRLNPDHSQARLDKAEALYRLSEAEDARNELQGVLARSPDAAPAHRLLGLVRLMLAQPDEALKPLGRASEIYSGWITSLRADEASAQAVHDLSAAQHATDGIIQLNRELAGVRLYEGMAWSDIAAKEPPESFLAGVWRHLRGEPSSYERALDKMKEAARLDPRRGDVPLQLGNVYMRIGDAANAANWLQQARTSDPSAPEPFYALAKLKESTGLPREAISVLNTLIETAPRSYKAYEELNRIYTASGDVQSARAALEQALRVAPQSAEDHLWRGRFLSALGSTGDAVAELQAAAADPQLWEAHLRLGEIFAQSGRGPDALVEFNHVLEAQPNNPTALLGAGRQMVLAGQVSEAEKLFSRLTALSPGDADGHVAYLQLLLSKGDATRALEEGKQAVRAAGDRADTHFYLGQAWEASDNWDEATKEYITATQRDPGLFDAFIRLARSLIHSDRYTESIEASKSAMALRPDDPQPYRWKAEAEMHLMSYEASVSSVATALNLNPNYADALAIGARAQALLGRDAEARNLAERAVQTEPQNAAGRFALGEVHLHAGRYQDADQVYRAVLQGNARSAEALTGVGRAQKGLGNPQEALKLFRDAVEGDATFAAAHLEAGHIYAETGQWGEAFSQYRRAAELRPRWPVALYYLGRAYLQKKDIANAYTTLTKAVEYSPNYVDAWFYLGLSDRERSHPAEAAQAFQRATQLNGTYSAAWLYLGLTYEESGNAPAAADAFGMARDTSTDSQTRDQAEQGLQRVK
ncbi:MAG TPA: tetratricopeptide repeat protein, partial [Chloroflexia bacterium]|nr:tetratricopeptide repeat protein [Chloroflexia bacterium]